MSSWGGYVFLINLIPLHVFTLMICGRYSHKVYVAYSTVYTLGTILSMQISFVGFQPVQTSEHMMVSNLFNSTFKIWTFFTLTPIHVTYSNHKFQTCHPENSIIDCSPLEYLDCVKFTASLIICEQI